MLEGIMRKNAKSTSLAQAEASIPAYPKLVSALLSQVTLTLAPDERSFYATSVADADALCTGARYESATVLDECVRMAALSLPSILAGKVAGYGPLRTRYLLELGQDLAGKVATLDESRITAAGKSAAKTTSLRDTRAMRRQALRALRNLAGKRAEERERLKRAIKGEERPDERSRSLEALATELEAAVAKVPARVATDAGVTPELMAALRQNAQVVLTSRSAAQGARGAVGSIYDEMNLLDGKILHELRLLAGAMRDAREIDKTVPLVRCSLLHQVRRAKAKPAPVPVPAPAPAPTNGAGTPAGAVEALADA
jgi:hypothetical protein